MKTIQTDSTKPVMPHASACVASQQGNQAMKAASSLSARKRIARICRELINESWLPIGLRSQVAEEVMVLSKIANTNGFDVENFAESVANLEIAIADYGDFTMESKVVKLVKDWKQELADGVQASPIHVLGSETAQGGQWQVAS